MLLLTLPRRDPYLLSSYKLCSELGGQEDIVSCAAFLIVRERIGLDGLVISSIKLHLPKQPLQKAV